MRVVVRWATALIAALGFWGGAVAATTFEDIERSVGEGRYDGLVARIDAYLATTPGDPKARFLKGVVLAEQDAVPQAIEVFTRLTVDFPDYPEPHNNLAVLYAAQGDFEKARDQLMVAINTHPSYATAYENLGDIYAKMAGMAYDRALRLEGDNEVAQAKLALLRDMVSARAASQRLERNPAPPVPPPVAETSPDAVRDALAGWARAWSAQDAGAYLAFYGDSFRPPQGTSRGRWERERRIRLEKPAFIEIDLSDVRVYLEGADRANVVFTQAYRSNSFRDRVRKRMLLTRDGPDWKIMSERTIE